MFLGRRKGGSCKACLDVLLAESSLPCLAAIFFKALRFLALSNDFLLMCSFVAILFNGPLPYVLLTAFQTLRPDIPRLSLIINSW